MNQIYKILITFFFIAAISSIFVGINNALIIATFYIMIIEAFRIVNVWINSIRRMLKMKDKLKKITVYKLFNRPLFTLPKWFIFDSRKSFRISHSVMFTDQSIYDNHKNTGVHKLFGFSLFHPHYESFRLGFHYRGDNNFSLHSYRYSNSCRIIYSLCNAAIGTRKNIEIVYNADEKIVSFIVDGLTMQERKVNYKYRFALAWINHLYVEVNQRISVLMK